MTAEQRIAALESKVAKLEVMLTRALALAQGPQGEPGRDGKDGRDGKIVKSAPAIQYPTPEPYAHWRITQNRDGTTDLKAL